MTAGALGDVHGTAEQGSGLVHNQSCCPGGTAPILLPPLSQHETFQDVVTSSQTQCAGLFGLCEAGRTDIAVLCGVQAWGLEERNIWAVFAWWVI